MLPLNFKFRRASNAIEGWFSDQDKYIFRLLLQEQNLHDASGNLLEIGCFQGKSTIVIGEYQRDYEEFYVCDSFGPTNNLENNQEIQSSYPSLSRRRFEDNYLLFHSKLPRIIQEDSLKLEKILFGKKFRFIHIDGSHLYHYVKKDLSFALQNSDLELGIIALDDFRAQHTLGVAKALWESILGRECSPLIFTASKVYILPFNSNFREIVDVAAILEENEIKFEKIKIFGNVAFRVLGLDDMNIYKVERWFHRYLPPAFIDFFKLMRRGE